VAVIAWFWLPADPESAWFLTDSQRDFAAERMRIDSERYILKHNTRDLSHRLNKRDVIETIKDWKLWTILVCNICASVPSQAFSVFLPLVVKDLGYASIQANLVSPITTSITIESSLINILFVKDVCSSLYLWSSGFISFCVQLRQTVWFFSPPPVVFVSGPNKFIYAARNAVYISLRA
jgi:hypothetical protein